MATGETATMAIAQLDASQAILTLLFAPDGKKDNGEWRWAAPVEGRTRLVKELFLLSRETKSGSQGLLKFDFTPGPYGPSSFEVTDALSLMIRNGLVGTMPLESGRGDRLMLAPAGGKEARTIWPRMPSEARADLYRVKSKFGMMTYRQLLVYVYRAYPEFTERSLIKDEILDETTG